MHIHDKYMCTFTLCGEYKLTANAKVLAEVRTRLIVGRWFLNRWKKFGFSLQNELQDELLRGQKGVYL